MCGRVGAPKSSAQVAAEERALLILLKTAETSVPTAVRMTSETIAISAAIRHYSIRVTPSLSARKRFISVSFRNMHRSPLKVPAILAARRSSRRHKNTNGLGRKTSKP